jgi:hypothetical protein
VTIPARRKVRGDCLTREAFAMPPLGKAEGSVRESLSCCRRSIIRKARSDRRLRVDTRRERRDRPAAHNFRSAA